MLENLKYFMFKSNRKRVELSYMCATNLESRCSTCFTWICCKRLGNCLTDIAAMQQFQTQANGRRPQLDVALIYSFTNSNVCKFSDGVAAYRS